MRIFIIALLFRITNKCLIKLFFKDKNRNSFNSCCTGSTGLLLKFSFTGAVRSLSKQFSSRYFGTFVGAISFFIACQRYYLTSPLTRRRPHHSYIYGMTTITYGATPPPHCQLRSRISQIILTLAPATLATVISCFSHLTDTAAPGHTLK